MVKEEKDIKFAKYVGTLNAKTTESVCKDSPKLCAELIAEQDCQNSVDLINNEQKEYCKCAVSKTLFGKEYKERKQIPIPCKKAKQYTKDRHKIIGKET